LAAGQALNAVGQYGLLYSMGFFLVAIAGLIVSIGMLRSGVFNRTVAYVGIVGNVFLLLNYVSLAFASTNISWLVVFVGVGAILSFVWWIFTGLRLYQIGRSLPK
jgi:membrane associated rhomboid family serine protease